MDAFELAAKLTLDSSGFEKGLKAAGAVLGTFAAASAVALGKVGSDAIRAYASYEQLTGGIETLFGANGAQTVEEYAASVGKSVDEVAGKFEDLKASESAMLDNAKNAYKTAGMSANEYMETATSFAASLVSSLDGDTVAAAKVADRAIQDMSDNANKMGTDISMIQNAYQGFAKQNYTMLDNLKLGYGGTKEEMARLIQDASGMEEEMKALGVTVDANSMSFDNIANAISVVQKRMGITGTTTREAAVTIEGSLNMTKAAWENLKVAFVDSEADMGAAINGLMEGLTGIEDESGQVTGGLINNVLGAVETMLPRMTEGFAQLGGLLISTLSDLLPIVLPALVSVITSMAETVATELPGLVASITDAAVQLLNSLVEILPIVAEALIVSFTTLIRSISGSLPELIPAVLEAILSIGQLIIDNIPELITAGVQIIMGLIQGIEEAIPQIIRAIPQIINGLVEGITQYLPNLLRAGLNLMDVLAQGILESLPVLIEQLPVLIDAILAYFTEAFPMILNSGIELLLALVDAIPVVITTLAPMIPQIVTSIVNALLLCMPELIQGAITLLMGIIEALPYIIGALVEAGPQIIGALITGLASALPLLLQAGFELFMGLIRLIPSVAQNMLAQAPVIITSLISGLLSMTGQLISAALRIGLTIINQIKTIPSRIIEVGKDIVRGLWEGISSMTDWVISKIQGFGDSVLGGLKKFFNIESPSKLMRDEVGVMLGLGVGAGIVASLPKVLAEVVAFSNEIARAFTEEVEPLSAGLSLSGGVARESSGGYIDNSVVNIYQPMRTPDEVARTIRLDKKYRLMYGGA